MNRAASIYIFRQGIRRYGYTLDKSGANLTSNFPSAPWEAMSAITSEPGEAPRAGPSMTDVQAGIARDGYYVVDGAVTVTQGTHNA